MLHAGTSGCCMAMIYIHLIRKFGICNRRENISAIILIQCFELSGNNQKILPMFDSPVMFFCLFQLVASFKLLVTRSIFTHKFISLKLYLEHSTSLTQKLSLFYFPCCLSSFCVLVFLHSCILPSSFVSCFSTLQYFLTALLLSL